MRQYKLIDGEHEIEIPAMELAFQLQGQIDSEDFDAILDLHPNNSVTFEFASWRVLRTQ